MVREDIIKLIKANVYSHHYENCDGQNSFVDDESIKDAAHAIYDAYLQEVKPLMAKERERCATIALEQRCERHTPWDAACLAIADAIRKLT